jgi:hypothetical protein
MEQKKYINIERFRNKYEDAFEKGDSIVVQEKIDGSNFSVRYDEETDTVMAFSRKQALDSENNLRGAWDWAQKLDKVKIREVLGTNLILFGEWLTPHNVVYPEKRYLNAYFYDVWDTETEGYLTQDKVRDIVAKLGLIYVPVFYEGEFESWEHLKQLVGRTELGGEEGEGIVIKSMTRLNDTDSRLPFYIKVVAEKFAENIPINPAEEKKMEKRRKQQMLVDSIVTEGRVTKLVHKMVDEGIIPENWSADDMGTITKYIGKEIYSDCMKEEPETVKKIGSAFGGMAHRSAMKIVKSMVR